MPRLRAGWEDWEVLVGNMWLVSRILPVLIKSDPTKMINLELGKYMHLTIYIEGQMWMRLLKELENNGTLAREGPGIKIPLEAQSIY